MSERHSDPDAYAFIRDYIDSVPHLESLILLWNSRPAGWTAEALALRLYIPGHRAAALLHDLMHLQLVQEVAGTPVRYAYLPLSEEQDRLMHRVETAYRSDLVGISNMVHAKAPSALRDFSRAFRFTKERGK